MYVFAPPNGLGWSDVHESPSTAQWIFGLLPPVKMCLEHSGGQQRCFTDAESQIAYDNNCERMGESCNSGGPSGNQAGNVWCCQRGVPSTTSSLNPGYVATPDPKNRILLWAIGLMLAGGIWFAISKKYSRKAADFSIPFVPVEAPAAGIIERLV